MAKRLNDIARTLFDTDYPRQVTLELTAYCNLRCIMCPHPSMKREKGIMSDGLYRKCVDEVAAEKPDTEVWLADHGESLLIGESLIDKAAYAKSRGLTKVYLNSNGMLLTRSVSRGLIDAGLDGIFFGIDAITKGTYESIRRDGVFETVMENIGLLLEERERSRASKLQVSVQFIEMEENEHELEGFVRYWSHRDVVIKIRRKLSWGGYIDTAKVKRDTTERIPCPWIINLMHILWDGRVCRCSGDHECNYPMGNVETETIAAIWRGPLRVERAIHLNRQFDRLNDQCTRCLDWKVGAAEKIRPRDPRAVLKALQPLDVGDGVPSTDERRDALGSD